MILVGAGATTGAIHLGSMVAGDGQQLPKNPAELLVGLIKGTVTWPAPATWILVGFGVILVALATLITRAVHKSASGSPISMAGFSLAGTTQIGRAGHLGGKTCSGPVRGPKAQRATVLTKEPPRPTPLFPMPTRRRGPAAVRKH